MSDTEPIPAICGVSGCSEGWLYYSQGSPADVCEDCHGTGIESPYGAHLFIATLRVEVERLRTERDNHCCNCEMMADSYSCERCEA